MKDVDYNIVALLSFICEKNNDTRKNAMMEEKDDKYKDIRNYQN